ncbi:hypothetical protein R1flu_021680 [Riccia fluitans]|uniref:ATP-binding cassette transporter n=1 Tax=Riccia fluitans TaxID=41844 RepID=A0ABD1ZQ28_9MARC
MPSNKTDLRVIRRIGRLHWSTANFCTSCETGVSQLSNPTREMEQEGEPLLGLSPDDGFEKRKGQKDSVVAAVDLTFVTRMWRLLRIAKCGDCVWLILLSIFSVAITSQAGLVVGHFYNALISKNLKLFATTIGQCLFWYGGDSVCSAAQLWTAEYLAIGWRMNLSQAAHSTYCSRPSLSALSQGHSLDNPDERLTNEVSSFCQTLAELMMKTIASPLMILYYTWWVWYHVGWIGPVVIYIFFFFGVTVTRMIISPIAGLVAGQEKLEADFRISHVRFYTNAEEIGMYDSLVCERVRLEKDLVAALANRKKLVSQHFLLKLSNKAYDYLGGILTYCVVAIPVFGGLFDTKDSGELANLISNSSFAVLQLIFGFSELMDSANLVSDVAGHCARIGELFEFLDDLPTCEALSSEFQVGLAPEQDDGKALDSAIQSSVPSTLWSTVRDQCHKPDGMVICPSTSFDFKNLGTLDLSICFTPSTLNEQLGVIFPEVAPSSFLMVTTFQFLRLPAAENLSESSVDKSWTAERRASYSVNPESALPEERLFMELISRVIQRLTGLGHWAAGIDIRSGAVIHPSDPHELDEENGLTKGTCVQPAERSVSKIPEQKNSRIKPLEYSGRTMGPLSSTEQESGPALHSYAVLVFMSAPVTVLRRVITTCVQQLAASYEAKYVANGESAPGQTSETQIQSFCPLLPAIAVNRMTFFPPFIDIPVILDLTMELQWGESLLIIGPSGSGKTSFLRTLCDLWPLDAGNKRVPPITNCRSFLLLPQQPLMAKAGLAGQITYPEPPPFIGTGSVQIVSQLHHALESVGMLSLLAKVHNNWEFESDWADILSPGEQQLLSLARVFYHQPQLVILDEATSALSEQAEDSIYGRLLELGVTIISVAHRKRLRCYHSRLLEIFGDGCVNVYIQHIEWTSERTVPELRQMK